MKLEERMCETYGGDELQFRMADALDAQCRNEHVCRALFLASV